MVIPLWGECQHRILLRAAPVLQRWSGIEQCCFIPPYNGIPTWNSTPGLLKSSSRIIIHDFQLPVSTAKKQCSNTLTSPATSLHGGSPPVGGAAGPILRPRRLHWGWHGGWRCPGNSGFLHVLGEENSGVSGFQWLGVGFRKKFGAGESYFVHQYNVSKDSKVVAPKVMSVWGWVSGNLKGEDLDLDEELHQHC